jgi:uncharacterized membrane protein YozB (DUF420 family)
MNSIKKVVGINLLILLAYTLLCNLVSNSNGNERGMEVAILMMVAVVIHVGILLLAMLIFFIRKNNAEGRTFLLSALIVLVIGFSACLGSTSLY